jgi:hypothetical protein
MVARKTAVSEPETRFSDADFEEWETVSSDFGTKIKWGNGPDETEQFVGVYKATREVPIGEVNENGEPFETAIAVEFADMNGELFYSWQNFALKDAIAKGTIQEGDTLMIKYTGEASTSRGLNPVKTFTIKVKPR